MHEHVFVLNEEIRRNYPAGWAEDERTEDAVSQLSALRERGCGTIADPTVIGLGRDIERIQRVAARTDLNIIVATGIYTYNDVPLYFRFRVAGEDGVDPMTDAVHRRHHRGHLGIRGQGGVPEVRDRGGRADARRRAGDAGGGPGARGHRRAGHGAHPSGHRGPG